MKIVGPNAVVDGECRLGQMHCAERRAVQLREYLASWRDMAKRPFRSRSHAGLRKAGTPQDPWYFALPGRMGNKLRGGGTEASAKACIKESDRPRA